MPNPNDVVKRRRRVPKPEALSEGDVYEFSLTAEVKTHGSSYWIRSGGATAIREGETTQEARKRLKDFIVECIADDAREVKEA